MSDEDYKMYEILLADIKRLGQKAYPTQADQEDLALYHMAMSDLLRRTGGGM